MAKRNSPSAHWRKSVAKLAKRAQIQGLRRAKPTKPPTKRDRFTTDVTKPAQPAKPPRKLPPWVVGGYNTRPNWQDQPLIAEGYVVYSPVGAVLISDEPKHSERLHFILCTGRRTYVGHCARELAEQQGWTWPMAAKEFVKKLRRRYRRDDWLREAL